MKRILIALLILSLLALTACGTAAGTSKDPGADVPPEPANTEPAEIQPVPGEQPQVSEPAPVPDGEYDPLEGLVRDQYEGLTISAVVLPRMAILPGSAIPVTVVVENTGDQTVTYVLGSGSYDTPDALIVRSDSLQPAPFRDRVGRMATMDYVTKELQPGETLEYLVYVMAVEPMADFPSIAYGLYDAEELYVADATLDQLQEFDSQITPVQPGSYTVQVSFAYSLVEEGEDEAVTLLQGPSGYAQAELTVSVTD